MPLTMSFGAAVFRFGKVGFESGGGGIDIEGVGAGAGGQPDAASGGGPRLAEGTELIGEYQGSGFQEPRFIVRRVDGQVIQLPRLLFLLASLLDGRRDLQALAALLTAEFGKVGAPQAGS